MCLLECYKQETVHQKINCMKFFIKSLNILKVSRYLIYKFGILSVSVCVSRISVQCEISRFDCPKDLSIQRKKGADKPFGQSTIDWCAKFNFPDRSRVHRYCCCGAIDRNAVLDYVISIRRSRFSVVD